MPNLGINYFETFQIYIKHTLNIKSQEQKLRKLIQGKQFGKFIPNLVILLHAQFYQKCHLSRSEILSYLQTIEMIKQYLGVLISEAGSKCKKLIGKTHNEKNQYNHKIYQFADFQLVKVKTEFQKETIQQMLISLVSLQLEINTIYIHLKYERLDLMRLKLKNLIGFINTYNTNICLIVSGSEYNSFCDVDEDYQLIEKDLCSKYEINNFCLSYSTRLGCRNITYFKYKNINNSINEFFFRITLKYNCQIRLDAMLMNLYPKIDQDIINELYVISKQEQNIKFSKGEENKLVNQEQVKQKNRQLNQNALYNNTQFTQNSLNQAQVTKFAEPQLFITKVAQNQERIYISYNLKPTFMYQVMYFQQNYFFR